MGDIGKFEIEVIKSADWDKAIVRIKPSSPDLDFGFWMCACEYFMRVTAQKSNAGFTKALALLMAGVQDYEDTQ